jgi:hypothetical protein
MSKDPPSKFDEQSVVSDHELDEIMARCNKSQPGPWRSYVEVREKFSGSDFIMTGGADLYLVGATPDDQDFIAHCKVDVERLVSEVRRLRKAMLTSVTNTAVP